MNGTQTPKPSHAMLSFILRKQTRKIVVIITSITVVIVAGYLVWSLRPIILPFIIGTFVAYLCFPLLTFFTRMGIPRPAGILLLFGTFFLVVMVLVNQVGSILPDEKDQLVLRTRFQYKLNERYQSLMGITKQDDPGNMLYKYFGTDLNRFMESINGFLRLSKEERVLFLKYRAGHKNLPPIKDAYYDYFIKNIEPSLDEGGELGKNQKENGKNKAETAAHESRIAAIMDAVKLWIILPFVFLFLLIDDGEIKRFFIGLVPNRYFEVSLAVVAKVNKAIGNYLRGILIECSLVGISYCILLFLIGFEIKIALMIGIIAGIANAIPLLGPAIALAFGSSYALIAENINSVIPFITANNLIIAFVACVLIVLIMDNAVFQPVVVGGAVKLHPLAVFIGIMGGSMLFGFAGLLLAVPTIVVVKELFSTLFRELKEYYII